MRTGSRARSSDSVGDKFRPLHIVGTISPVLFEGRRKEFTFLDFSFPQIVVSHCMIVLSTRNRQFGATVSRGFFKVDLTGRLQHRMEWFERSTHFVRRESRFGKSSWNKARRDGEFLGSSHFEDFFREVKDLIRETLDGDFERDKEFVRFELARLDEALADRLFLL